MPFASRQSDILVDEGVNLYLLLLNDWVNVVVVDDDVLVAGFLNDLRS